MAKRKADTEAASSKSKDSKKGDGDREATLLGYMVQQHMHGNHAITLPKVANDLGFHKGNKAMGAVWTAVKDAGYTEASSTGKGRQMTQKGLDYASTPEYKEFLKDKNFIPQDNEEHQARIKKRLDDMGIQIFDLLLKHGSLSRDAIAGMFRTKPGSKTFFYAEQVLRKKGIVEKDPANKKQKRLSDAAFMKPEDRPEPVELDAEVLAEAVKYATTRNKDTAKDAPKKTKKSDKKGDKELVESTNKETIKSDAEKTDKDAKPIEEEEASPDEPDKVKSASTKTNSEEVTDPEEVNSAPDKGGSLLDSSLDQQAVEMEQSQA